MTLPEGPQSSRSEGPAGSAGWMEIPAAERSHMLPYIVSHVLVEAEGLSDATLRILEAVGTAFSWELGVVWFVDRQSEQLQSSTIWHVPLLPAEEFVAHTRRTRFAAGVGLPGRVWESGKPCWIADVLRDDNFPRVTAAASQDLHAAFAFPVRGSRGILGVVEFFSHHIRPPDAELLQTAVTLGNQIGAYLEKQLAEEVLREHEARTAAIIEAALDAIISIDHEGRILDFNPAAQTIFGLTRGAALGRRLEDTIIPPSLRERHRRGLAEYLATGHTRILGQRIELTALRADGTEFPVELTVTRIPTTGPPMFTGHLRDITDRIQAYHLLEQRVEERTVELRTLLQTSRSVASTLELRPLLGVILDGLKGVADYATASVWTRQGEDMVLAASRSPAGDASPVPARFALAQVAPDIWQSICAGEPVIVDTVLGETEEARAYHVPFGASPGSSRTAISWMAVPLMVKERVTGMLTLSHDRPRFYTRRHASLAVALGHQAAVAIENAELYARAQEIAVLEERQRLARELHDSVSQALYSIVLGTRAAQDQVNGDRARLIDALDYVLSLAGAALSEMRTLIFELRPERLEREGLVGALRTQIRSLEGRHGLEVTATLGDEPDVPLTTKEVLYRIAQEAMHNIVKHAQARTVSVAFEQRGQTLVLEVQDDGKGFDPRAPVSGHLGLPSMRERAARLGGRLSVRSEPGHGAQVVVDVPLPDGPSQP